MADNRRDFILRDGSRFRRSPFRRLFRAGWAIFRSLGRIVLAILKGGAR